MSKLQKAYELSTQLTPTDEQLRLAFDLCAYERELFAARAAVTVADQNLERAKTAYKEKCVELENERRAGHTYGVDHEPQFGEIDISQLEFTNDPCGSKLIRFCVRDASNPDDACIFCSSRPTVQAAAK